MIRLGGDIIRGLAISERKPSLSLYLDPSTSPTLPPGHDRPGFDRAFAEARMLFDVALAGASKRVLHRLVRTLDPSARSIAVWMVRELKAARLLSVDRETLTLSIHTTPKEIDHV